MKLKSGNKGVGVVAAYNYLYGRIRKREVKILSILFIFVGLFICSIFINIFQVSLLESMKVRMNRAIDQIRQY